MIYSIMSKPDLKTDNIHNYLLNHTGDYGNNIPELFIDLGNLERVNGLYAFAIASIITDDFSKSSQMMSGYETLELNILSFIQYLKGLATTESANKKIDNPNYDTLKKENMLGVAPTLLNLDGTMFLYKHFDPEKYSSADEADMNEDSFPYWVINRVHEIETSNAIEKESKVDWKLPYYVQNQSKNPIKIVDSDLKTRIGRMEPSAIEGITKIVNGYGQLASSKSAFIKLSNGIVPFKHMINEYEIDGSFKIISYPDPPFDICIKGTADSKNKTDDYPIIALKGITSNYLPTARGGFMHGEVVRIIDTFHDIYGITDTGEYIPLDASKVALVPASEEEMENHAKNSKLHDVIDKYSNLKITLHDDSVFDASKPTDNKLFEKPHLILIDATTEEWAKYFIAILKTHRINCPYVYIDKNENNDIFVVVSSHVSIFEAQKQKRMILAITGLKAYIVPTKTFYNL